MSAPRRSVIAIVLGLACLAMAALLSPLGARQFVSLDWKVGDPGLVLWGAAAGPALVAAFLLLCPAAASRFLRRCFPDRRRTVQKLLLSLAATALTLMAGEVFFRLRHIPFAPQRQHLEVSLCQFDPELGWVYRPDLSLQQPYGRTTLPMHFDEHGIRIPAPDARPDPQAPTLLLIGGSFTFGHGLRYEDSFAGQLAAQDDLGLQVVNLGVQAYGTDQALLRMKRHLDDFPVRVVVYTYITAHVARNENYDRRMLYPDARFLGTKPLFHLTGDGALEVARWPVLYRDLRYCRVWTTARMAWQHYGPPPSTDLTRALVAEMKRAAESRGARFLVVDWKQETPMSRVLPKVGDPLVGLGVPIVDPSADAPPEWNRWTIPGDGHPDARAHAHVARRIAAELHRLERE